MTEKLTVDARFLRVWLAQKNMPASDLAALAGISQPTLSRLMNGYSFESATIDKLAGAMGVEPYKLLAGGQ